MNCDSEVLQIAVRNVAREAAKLPQKADWRQYDERSLWYELVACILGSRVTFENAGVAASRLRDTGILDALLIDRHGKDLEELVAVTLSRRDEAGLCAHYPFPRSRARYICWTAEVIYRRSGSLASILRACRDGRDARASLADRCLGIGPKQASLFLRNIGYSPELAILDTHVLQFMNRTGLMPDRCLAVPSLASYERLERVLGSYARVVGVSVGILDIAIWVVMRTAQKEFSQ